MRDIVSTLEMYPGQGINVKLGDSLIHITCQGTETKKTHVPSKDINEVMDVVNNVIPHDGHVLTDCGLSSDGDASIYFGDNEVEVILRADGTWCVVDETNKKYYGNTD